MSATITTLKAPVVEADDKTTTVQELTTSPATAASLYDKIDLSRPFTMALIVTRSSKKRKRPRSHAAGSSEYCATLTGLTSGRFLGESVNTVASMHQVPLYGLGINYATTKDAHQ
jgi:hypothetical protein